MAIDNWKKLGLFMEDLKNIKIVDNWQLKKTWSFYGGSEKYKNSLQLTIEKALYFYGGSEKYFF